MRTFKILKIAALGLLLTGITSNLSAEISEKDFKAAFEKYLSTDSGQEKLAGTIQTYFRKQQAAAQKGQAANADKQIEEQFKNPKKVDAGISPFKGPKDAPITIVEFSDFECPFCSRGDSTMKEVIKNYGDKVKLVFKHLPLSFHKNAEPAARATLAAHKQGKFWEMHDIFFKNQRGLNEEFYISTAKELGLDLEKFKKDYASEEIKKAVEADMELAKELGISGTPGFAVNGVMVKGAYPYPHFEKIINKWLEMKKVS